MHRLHPSKEVQVRNDVIRLAHGSATLRCAHRLHVVLLVTVGHRCPQVAQWFGDNARTIERWVHAYELQGLEGLKDHPGAGRPSRLTALQQAQLALDLATGPRCCGFDQALWSGKLLARHLALRFGVVLSQRHCQRLLRQRSP